MATAQSVKEKLQGLISTANGVTGRSETNLTAAVNALAEGFGKGGKITEYEVNENADRSLWVNENNIKLVKGVNILMTSKMEYSTDAACSMGALSFMFMLWDGVPVTNANGTDRAYHHLRGYCFVQNAWNFFAGVGGIIAGNTKTYSISEDGTLTFTTSATGVTTGNYANNFIEGGYTHRLIQLESDVVC